MIEKYPDSWKDIIHFRFRCTIDFVVQSWYPQTAENLVAKQIFVTRKKMD